MNRTGVLLLAAVPVSLVFSVGAVKSIGSPPSTPDTVKLICLMVPLGPVVLAVAITAALLVAAYSPRLTHVAVLHLALAYEVVACLFMATIVPWFTI